MYLDLWLLSNKPVYASIGKLVEAENIMLTIIANYKIKINGICKHDVIQFFKNIESIIFVIFMTLTQVPY